jgi:hypothetical protein
MLIPLSAGLRFFTAPRLALNPNLIFEIGSKKQWEVISLQGWNKRGSLGGVIALVNGKAEINV